MFSNDEEDFDLLDMDVDGEEAKVEKDEPNIHSASAVNDDEPAKDESIFTKQILRKLHVLNYHADYDQLKARYPTLDLPKEELEAVIAACGCKDQVVPRRRFNGRKLRFYHKN
jgi:hypothetical protein